MFGSLSVGEYSRIHRNHLPKKFFIHVVAGCKFWTRALHVPDGSGAGYRDFIKVCFSFFKILQSGSCFGPVPVNSLATRLFEYPDYGFGLNCFFMFS